MIGEIKEDIGKEQMEIEQLEDRQAKAISSIDESCKQIIEELRNVTQSFLKQKIEIRNRVKGLG